MILMALHASAYHFATEGFYYDINGGDSTVTVTYDTYLSGCYSGDLIVPDSVEYNGKRYAITAIGASAFRGGSNLTSVSLPDGVTSIGQFAFRDCTVMTAATLGSGVTHIGNYAFDKCEALEAIELPEGVTSIGDCAFRECTSLAWATLHEGLTTIGRWAFIDCHSLQKIEIPASVTEIGTSAFQSCNSLGSVAINLRPETKLKIGKLAFIGCNAITTVTTNDIALWCGINFDGVNANPANFSHSIALNGVPVSKLDIPGEVKRIEKYAFYSCNELLRLQLPTSIKEIGDSAFWHCYGLSDITCLSPTPIEIGNVFVDYTYQNAILTVPYGSAELYREASPWNKFAAIQELPAPKKGDLNDDGAVDGGDVSILLEMVLAGGVADAQKTVADLNGDGSMDGGDVSILLEMVLSGADEPQEQLTPPDWENMETLKILSIGNSFALDGLKYISELIEASGIDSQNIQIYLVHKGSATLQLYAELSEADTLPSDLYFEQMYGVNEMWEITSLADIIARDWDIVVLQQESSNASNYSTYQPYLNQLVDFIKSTCLNKNVAIGWNLVWGVWPITAEDPGISNWERKVAACQQMLKETDYFSFIVPSGTAVQNARALGIDNDGHCLTRDNWHLCYGAGRYAAACAWWEAIIAPWSGISVVGNSAIHAISEAERSASANPSVPVTADNNIILQLCAKYAATHPLELTIENITTQLAEERGIADIPSMFTIDPAPDEEGDTPTE